jgi:glycosyltransferase involved in cell wall biosynthesis
VFGRWPLPVENYISPQMTKGIATAITRSAFDLIHLDGVHLAAYIMCLREIAPTLPVVVNWHNIESEGMRRYAMNAPSFARGLYARITGRKLAATERMLLGAAFGNIVCSERERQELLAVSPRGARIAVIENGVDVSSFDCHDEDRAVPAKRILFVGAMDYHPNVDAMMYFSKSVWPGLYQAFPDWRLTIVGSHPVPAVQALANEPGIEVTGTVADVRPYYREAFACIVPLRTGMGTRLKILEAMAAGVPVISTAIGAEGLAVEPGENILIADREQEWRSALTSLIAQPNRLRLVRAGRALVSSRYDWETLGEQAWQTYHQWINE